MADDDVTNDQIWPNIADLDVDTYSLYQRRFPRRLPKLNDFKRSPKEKKLKVLTPPGEEAMPMKPTDYFFGRREKCKDEAHQEVRTLEDFEEDEGELPEDIQFEKPITTKNMVAFQLKDSAHTKRHGHSSLDMDKASRIGCTSRFRSTNSLSKSPSRNTTPVDNIMCSHRGKLDLKQRSQSLYEPRSTFGRNTPIGASKASPKESCDFISKFSSQKERTSIQSLAKDKKVNITKTYIPTPHKRRHTYHLHERSDELNRINNAISKAHTREDKEVICTDIEEDIKSEVGIPEEDLCETLVKKKVDKSSREYFFNHTLENDIQMGLLEDVRNEILPQTTGLGQLRGEPITNKVAYTLRMLLFGSCLPSFTAAWREQTISYVQPNRYNLKFYKDGPVEVMAPLQAYILKHLLFQNKDQQTFKPNARLSPNVESQQQLLLTAMCDMIWKAGDEKHGIIALPIGESQFIPDYSYRNDDITEKMELFKFSKQDDLQLFVKQNIQKFQDVGKCGCISLLYSLMLSRGLSRFLEDCSEIKQGILEARDTAERSQSLINLCIYGKAVPNICNNYTEVYNEVENKVEVHKGILKRCEIGYLTHSEYVNIKVYEVGSCLKTPRYPIWVLNNNGKLSVLFSMKRELLSDWKLERRFDLYYYQGIARYVPTSEIDITLTIDTIQTLMENDLVDEDNSTLEETIRTKWKDSVIGWNGYTRF